MRRKRTTDCDLEYGGYPLASGSESTSTTVWALIIAISLALGIAAILMVQQGWRLVGDEAVVTVRSTDVLGAGSPLLGMPSGIGGFTGGAVEAAHPGPLAFWALAPFTTALGPSPIGALLGTWFLASISVACIGWTASRRLGTTGALWTLGLVLTFLAVNATSLSPLNPLMAVMPLLATYFLAWAVIGGDEAVWPGLLLAASFVLQADLTFLPSVFLAVAPCAISTLLRQRGVIRPGPRPISKKGLGVSAAVLLLVWSLPLAEALAHRGGNVVQLAKAALAGIPVQGVGSSLSSVATMFSPSGLIEGGERSATWLGLALLTMAMFGLRLRRPSRRSLVAVAALSIVGAAASQYSVPVTNPNRIYELPVTVSTVMVWFTLLLLCADMLGAISKYHLSTSPGWAKGRRYLKLGILLAVPLVLLPRVVATQRVDQRYLSVVLPRLPNIIDSLRSELSPGQYSIVPLGSDAVALMHAFVAELDGSSIAFRTDGFDNYLGAKRRPDGSELGTLLLTPLALGPPITGARRVSADLGSSSEPRITLEYVAETVRRQPEIQFSSSANGYFVGSILLAAGDLPNLSSKPDVMELSQFGDEVLASPESARQLSDGALALLVAQNAFEMDSDSGRGLDEQVQAVYDPTFWLLPKDNVAQPSSSAD